MIEDWDEHPIICIKKIYLERRMENVCGCDRCKGEKKSTYLGPLFIEGEWEETPDY